MMCGMMLVLNKVQRQKIICSRSYDLDLWCTRNLSQLKHLLEPLASISMGSKVPKILEQVLSREEDIILIWKAGSDVLLGPGKDRV